MQHTPTKKRVAETPKRRRDEYAIVASKSPKKRRPNTSSLVQRIPTKYFVEKVVKDVPDEHAGAIRSIGFGGLLDLDLGRHNSLFAEDLISSFDVDTYSLVMENGQGIDIKVEDAHIVYGVPLGGHKIIENPDENDEEWSTFLAKYRAIFNLTTGVPDHMKLVDRIEELKKKPVCDEFIWHFVLFAVNCCIRSNRGPQLRFMFLYNCMDTKKIKDYDWSAFVHRSVKESIEEWRDSGSSYFSGPLPFLMVCILLL